MHAILTFHVLALGRIISDNLKSSLHMHVDRNNHFVLAQVKSGKGWITWQ